MRVSQGFWGTREHWQNIEGNKGTLGNFWEQGNKFRKITVRKHTERVHRAILEGNKGTRTPPPPGRPSVMQFLNQPLVASHRNIWKNTLNFKWLLTEFGQTGRENMYNGG